MNEISTRYDQGALFVPCTCLPSGERKWKKTLESTSERDIIGTVYSMARRRPMASMNQSATSVARKLIPLTMMLTASGSLNPTLSKILEL